MSITCNYCKAAGHRIHAADQFGTYLLGPDGQRILACPVLIRKDQKKVKTVEEEFPPLPGSNAVAADYTATLIQAIASATKEKKQQEWLDRENLRRISREKREVKQGLALYNKYGSTWFFSVCGNPKEDSGYASRLRDQHEEEDRKREDQMYYENEAREAEWEVSRKERSAKRATMSADQARLDEEAEEEEDEDAWIADANSREYALYMHVSAQQLEKNHYDTMGWPWPPVR